MGIFNIVIALLMSLVIIGGGYMCKSLAGDDINGFAGYRTTMSKKNKDTWREANTYAGKIIRISGEVYLILSIFICIYFYSGPDYMAAIIALLLIPVLVADIIIVEKHLRYIFDENGNRK